MAAQMDTPPDEHEDREVVIEVNDLHTRIGKQEVHRGLSFKVYRGEVLGVIGTTGSGKTTLLRQIIGLIRPASGWVEVLGQRIHSLEGEEVRLLRRRWGVLFQQGALFSALTVFDNIAFPIRELRKEGEDIEEEAIRDLVGVKLHIVGLDPEDAWKYPAELSGGMLKRAALARALALEAEMLFLDEPTTGLDPISASEFDTLLDQLHHELNLTALMITHDLHSLAALSDRIAVLDEGKLLTIGSLVEVAEFDHPFIQDFFRRRRGDEELRALPSY
ncbi:MAG TPA: ATP-binding cassette domain-containing protein [Gammaproteobacteria bacterium]|nr:ATP-binding cassette domain-containing protein [Gammaproteobacteria bacterium]